LVDGINSTIIVYGSKGSGKGYTVFGTREDYKVVNTKTKKKEHETDGLLARLVRNSFEGILSLPESIELSIKISSYEVEKSGETLLDLLSGKTFHLKF
jgi:hypothetical protein